MAVTADVVAVDLIATDNGYTAKMGNARRSLLAFQGTANQSADDLQRRQVPAFARAASGVDLYGAALRRLTPIFIALAALNFARSLLTQADALQDMAQQIGITTQELQGLQSVARDTGASQEGLRQGLASLTDQLGDAARGEGELAKMMRELNIPLGTAMQVMFDFADAVQKAETQSEKMRISTTLFGRAGKTLTPVLAEGADGLKRMLAQAQQKGQIWDPETVAKLGEVHDALERLKVTLTGQFANPFAAAIRGAESFLKYLETFKRNYDKNFAPLPGVTIPIGPPATGPMLANSPLRQGAPTSPEAIRKAATDAAAAAREVQQALESLDETDRAIIADRLQAVTAGYREEEQLWNEATRAREEYETTAAKTHEDSIARQWAADLEYIEQDARADEEKKRRAEQLSDMVRSRVIGDIAELGAIALTSSENFGEAMKRMTLAVIQLIIQLQIAKALEAVIGPGSKGGGIVGSIFNNILGRDSGGAVQAGTPYRIGRGPYEEVFIPRTSGVVVPNASQMGAGRQAMNINAPVYISLDGANGDRTIIAYAQRAAEIGVATSLKSVKQMFPGMMVDWQKRSG